jgi:predicted NBD/HSP70 family sugar kinase
MFAPELIIVGGGFGIAAFEFLVPSALEIARRETVEPDALPVRIVSAELGSDAGLIGAGLVAFEALEAK